MPSVNDRPGNPKMSCGCRWEGEYPTPGTSSSAVACWTLLRSRHADRRRCWLSLALDVVPRAGADAIACIDTWRVATLFLAEICVPSARGSLLIGFVLANLIGAREPAKVARTRRVIGNKEARDLRP
jgi:hypothetical protein